MIDVRMEDYNDYTEEYKESLVILFETLSIDIKPIIEKLDLNINRYVIVTEVSENCKWSNSYYSFSFLNKCYDEKTKESFHNGFIESIYLKCIQLNNDNKYKDYFSITARNLKSIMLELDKYLRTNKLKNECNSFEEYCEMMNNSINAKK